MALNAHTHSHSHEIDSGHGQEVARPGSLFIGLMGTPYQSDITTSLFRLTEATLSQGHQVTVWTCGYGTMLTQSTLVRPSDALASESDGDGADHMTTAALVQGLFRAYPQKLRWYVCRYCMEERGAVAQIPEIEVQIPYSFNTYLTMADQGLVLGTKS